MMQYAGANDSFRAGLVKFLQENPGWKSARQLEDFHTKFGHGHTAREIAGILTSTQGVERYRATDRTTYYRWSGKNIKEMKA